MPNRSLFASAILACVAAVSVHATVLTYDFSPQRSNDTALPADYGNRVSSGSMAGGGGTYSYGNFGEGFTPNVTVQYGSGTFFYGQNNPPPGGYGALVNVAYADDGTFQLTFTADPGFNVRLFSFDLAGFDNSFQINSVSVFSGVTQLFSQSNVTINGSSNGTGITSFTFGTPLLGSALTLSFDASNLGGNAANIGIDNIRFGSAPVPEPSTTAIVIMMAGLIVLFQRRRFARS